MPTYVRTFVNVYGWYYVMVFNDVALCAFARGVRAPTRRVAGAKLWACNIYG